MILLLLIACFILFHVFIVSQLYYWLRGITQAAWLKPVLVIYGICGTLLPVLGTVWPVNGSVKNMLQAAGNIYLGIAVYLALSLTVLWIVRVIARAARHGFGPRPAEGVSAAFMLVCAFFTISMNLFGYINARDPQVTGYEVSVGENISGQNLSSSEQGRISSAALRSSKAEDSGVSSRSLQHGSLKIVLLSDLHLGVNTSVKHMEEAVEKINAEDPDVVLIAGDFFNSTFYGVPEPDRLAEIFRGIKSKHGVFYCWGNHDIEEPLFCGFTLKPASKVSRSEEMEEFVRECGFKDLNDREVTVEGVQFVGRADGSRSGDGTAGRLTPKQLMAMTDPDLPTVVLEHEPVEYRELEEAGADLVLSGHTHGGQIWPGNLIVDGMFSNAAGEKDVDGLKTITTAGLGYYGPPIRTGCRSEISAITFTY